MITHEDFNQHNWNLCIFFFLLLSINSYNSILNTICYLSIKSKSCGIILTEYDAFKFYIT